MVVFSLPEAIPDLNPIKLFQRTEFYVYQIGGNTTTWEVYAACKEYAGLKYTLKWK